MIRRIVLAVTLGTVAVALVLFGLSISPRAVFVLLLGASVLFGTWFVIRLGLPWRSELPGAAWLQTALASCAVAFDVLFLLVLVRVATPIWVWALVVIAQDGAFAWRLARLRAVRAQDRERAGRS